MKSTVKKYGIFLLCLTILLGATAAFAGCDAQTNPTTADNNCTTIICTNFAALSFARSMLDHYREQGGEGVVQLMILGKPGQDMHSYEPTAQDIINLVNADVVVCTGAEGWLDSALSASGNKVARMVSMMEACDIHTTNHDHDREHEHGDDSCALIGNDEHVWLSVDNATRITVAIGDALKEADKENATAWEACKGIATAELVELKTEFHVMMKNATRDTVVIADRHPFVYLFAELNLDCVAAFPGCSSETSASFETQMKLIESVKSLGIPYIFIMEGSDGKVAEVVAKETGAEILTLNSMQVMTDFYESTYIDIMRQNLENLKKALQ